MRIEETTLTPDQREWLNNFQRLRQFPFLSHRVRVVGGANVALLATGESAARPEAP